MSLYNYSALLLTLCALALGACQPLPRPFAPRADNPLVRLDDSAGIVVAAITGLPAAQSDALRAAMAEQLRKRNIPAETEGGNRASLVLTGQAVPAKGGAGLDVLWLLSDARGRPRGMHQSGIVDGGAVAGRLDTIASEAAPVIAALIQPPAPRAAPESARTGPADGPAIHVWPIAGAPPNGEPALRAALTAALKRAGMRIVPAEAASSLVIAGSFRLDPAAEGLQTVTLDWSVLRPDGHTLGTLSQSNPVAAGTFERPWTRLARSIGIAAASGVVDLLTQLAEKTGKE